MTRADRMLALACASMTACSLVAGFEPSYEPFPADSGVSTSASTGGDDGRGDAGHGGSASVCTELCAVGTGQAPAGCDVCRARVADELPACASAWQDACVAAAIRLCDLSCCGDGLCAGESCGSCPQDCECSCAHSPCERGAPLSAESCPAMKDCIESVCKEKPACCDEEWGPPCGNRAGAACDATCSCVEALCVATQEPLASDCDPCVPIVCSAEPSCCADQWSSACVDLVETLCGIRCS